MRSRKWLKWGIGAGATISIALLFQTVKQSDVFSQAVASNLQHQPSPTATAPKTDTVQPFYFTFPQEPETSWEKAPQARTHASPVAPDEDDHDHHEKDKEDRDDKDKWNKRKRNKNHDEDDWDEDTEGDDHELHNNRTAGAVVNIRRNYNQALLIITDQSPFPGHEHRDRGNPPEL